MNCTCNINIFKPIDGLFSHIEICIIFMFFCCIIILCHLFFQFGMFVIYENGNLSEKKTAAA